MPVVMRTALRHAGYVFFLFSDKLLVSIIRAEVVHLPGMFRFGRFHVHFAYWIGYHFYFLITTVWLPRYLDTDGSDGNQSGIGTSFLLQPWHLLRTQRIAH